MQTLSSASRTCIASASAVEWTATVAMPSSFAARKIRSAISPRFAIRILSNIFRLFDHEQGLAEFDWLAVLDEYRRHGAGPGRCDLVEGFHGFDQQQLVADRDARADFDERLRLGRGFPIGGADHGRGDRAGMAGRRLPAWRGVAGPGRAGGGQR